MKIVTFLLRFVYVFIEKFLWLVQSE